jgi:23S rRNA (adenine1618-N6)-methyltransferase
LKHYYGLEYWDIPSGYLCPPIPGRADYIHHMADLLMDTNSNIQCLDIGTGANLIYPIIGVKEYNWHFVGTEIDPIAIENARKIIDTNSILKGKIELRMQQNASKILEGIIQKEDNFDIVICNPPFHASAQEAQAGTLRKLSNLKNKKVQQPILNFGGQHNELWCIGGESHFIRNMIQESKVFANQCHRFSSLVSKEATLKDCMQSLNQMHAADINIIPMGQGNKVSRILVWSW